MPRDNTCMYMAHVCFMSVVVIVWGSVGVFVSAWSVEVCRMLV